MLSYGDPNPVDLERQRRNKMGRPLNKRNFGDTGDAGQQISVSADVGAGAGAGFIVKQKGSKRFLCSVGGTTAVCKMVTAAPAAPGEVRITLADSAAGTYFASKISGRTCTVEAGTGTQFSTGDKVAWNTTGAVLNESLEITNA
jgi:hypothetical protein|tara:strand:+ start:1283 stop:1714 length:432 start_codon:yes stop_codon:yes gene_type:complete